MLRVLVLLKILSVSNIFEDAVALRMRSDVKVGTCLSGGLDSASIAAYAAEMQRHSASGKFSAITAKSTEAANDESGFAELVVSYNDLKWIISQPTYNDFASTIAAVTRAQESLRLGFYCDAIPRHEGCFTERHQSAAGWPRWRRGLHGI